MKARQEEAETQPLVDEEDEQIQKILSSEVEPSLVLDEFIAHTNVAPPAQESIPSQVEAVYKDVNAMIDTLGLNSRTVKAFIKGHSQPSENGKTEDDLDDPDSWVLCEMNDLGEILQQDLNGALVESRVNDKEDKLDECLDLARDVQRLRAKQGDLKQLINARLDPDQADVAQSLPLSAEQAAQQSELRREFAEFSKQLAEAEKALTMLRTQIAAASGASGRGNSNVPTVEAVMRTITKMTSMVEKRSGDVDVLENQLRKMRLNNPPSREGSPIVTPRRERSVMFSPETTPSRSFRHSLSSSMSKLGLATPPRKKLSGFSKEEKTDLMERKTRRQAVLAKLRDNVEKKGVTVWNMEDVE
jgi:nucleoporin NUP159